MTDAGCWEWNLRRDKYGYARSSTLGRVSHLVHRVSYTEFVGPIPKGLQLDHLCRNRACINPDHLEPVTNVENQLRAAPFLASANASECKNGHKYTPENTYMRPSAASGRRQCRTCNREAARRYAARKKETA